MLTEDFLINLLASRNLSQQDKVLLILLSQDKNHLSARNIQSIALAHGVKQVTAWNVPRTLTSVYEKGYAVKMPEGWILTSSGRRYIQEKFPLEKKSVTREIEIKLRSYLEKIPDTNTHEFVGEAIGCLESGYLKSAVVMSWVGAMSLLYNHIISDRDRLKNFNDRAIETSHPNKKWKPALTRDDLMLMKESEFLDILAYISVLPKNTKDHLKNVCLNLRNSCGHPSSIKVEEYNVKAHIEFLILNVYECF